MSKFISTRRDFMLGSVALTASATFGSMLPNLAQAATMPLNMTPQRKALVFIMLDGGNDSYNMLVPNEGTAYREYKKSRSNLAHDQRDLLQLEGYEDSMGRSFGLHNAMPEVQKLFHEKKLSFVSNIGPLIEPVGKSQTYDGSARLPLGLLSHADQFKHWQTSRPDRRQNDGWFGYFADTLQPNRKDKQIPMNISMAGNNISQNGGMSTPYAITENGSVGLIVNEEKSQLNNLLLDNFEALLNTNYDGDPFKETYLSLTREAQMQHDVFFDATADIPVPTNFSDSSLSQQLKKVVQTIKAADRLHLNQQTFFLRYIGWDHHDELLNNQNNMLRILSKALGEFQTALIEMGLEDKVVTFTGSDFGRTLTSNGNGTDHGWGGNTMVMGVPVKGGQLFGQYPRLGLGSDNPLDMGDGVLIPTTSTDQLYADLSLWFGVPYEKLGDLFPNLSNFHNLSSGKAPLGIIKG